ncbi:MAG: DUF4190 domain-containing protein [Nanoarchaeota archaeon]|nr:DUF4190 domain-containing protein [Nanoarchaeota archaeon]
MTQGLAKASLVLGILALVLVWLPGINIILAILAIVFGIISLVKLGKNKELGGKGLSIAGIIMGGVGVILTPISLAFIGAMAYFGVISPANMLPETCLFPAGTDCIEKPMIQKDGVITFTLKNSLGYDISFDASQAVGQDPGDECDAGYVIQSIQVPFPGGADTICLPDNEDCRLRNGDAATFKLRCQSNLPLYEYFQSRPKLKYRSVDTQAEHMLIGDIRAKVE